jgi:hypothetical protein
MAAPAGAHQAEVHLAAGGYSCPAGEQRVDSEAWLPRQVSSIGLRQRLL